MLYKCTLPHEKSLRDARESSEVCCGDVDVDENLVRVNLSLNPWNINTCPVEAHVDRMHPPCPSSSHFLGPWRC